LEPQKLNSYDSHFNSDLKTVKEGLDDHSHKRPKSERFSRTNDNDQINFINYTQRYCIGIVDIMDSTKETAKIKDSRKLRKYYSLFLNTMNSIIDDSNGKIVKNGGDSLFFYFPKTSDVNNEIAFHEAFECGTAMVKANNYLNEQLFQEDLPAIKYRISMEYGEVEIAISPKSNNVDLFGFVINECSKMKSVLQSTGLVIGKKLYEITSESYFIKDYVIARVPAMFTNDNEESRNSSSVYSVVKQDQSTHKEKGITIYNERERKHGKENIKGSDNGGVNIILIDDDEDVLYTYRALLKREGYNVKSFSNPLEALKHLTQNTPHFYDLVLLDIRMPDINGIQLYYKLKAINPYLNILFISALDIVQEVIDALPGIQSNDIIRKPVNNEDLLARVKSTIQDSSYYKKYF
jgi:CheY-like chemotaxis protein/class 3 adenylate cyclase